MPNKVTMTLIVDWKGKKKCVREEKVYMTKGTKSKESCKDPKGNPHLPDERELEIKVDDRTNTNTVIFVGVAHGKPGDYFEQPPDKEFPVKVTPTQSRILLLRKQMWLDTRDEGEPCFLNSDSPFAQLVQLTHLDEDKKEIPHCVPMQHTYVHIEC